MWQIVRGGHIIQQSYWKYSCIMYYLCKYILFLTLVVKCLQSIVWAFITCLNEWISQIITWTLFYPICVWVCSVFCHYKGKQFFMYWGDVLFFTSPKDKILHQHCNTQKEYSGNHCDKKCQFYLFSHVFKIHIWLTSIIAGYTLWFYCMVLKTEFFKCKAWNSETIGLLHTWLHKQWTGKNSSNIGHMR